MSNDQILGPVEFQLAKGPTVVRHADKPTRHSYNRNFRKTFITFCTALLLESVALQLITTAGDTEILANNSQNASIAGQTVQVPATGVKGESITAVQATPTPTPKPTTIIPNIAQPVLAAAPIQPISTGPLVFHSPLRSYTLTQRFSYYHQAIDMADPQGTPIYASTAGTVAGTGYLIQGGGLMVKIDHGNGYVTYYAHLSVITAVVGQKVDNSTMIGKVGTTGWSTGPHLHFMIWHNSVPLDPLSLIK